jgi:hypothetical protein
MRLQRGGELIMAGRHVPRFAQSFLEIHDDLALMLGQRKVDDVDINRLKVKFLVRHAPVPAASYRFQR